MAKSSPTSTTWDPILLISQIISMQTLHYLTLSLLIPPLLNVLAEPSSLAYEGGASNIGMIMDWREMAGRPTIHGIHTNNRWASYTGAWSGGKKVGYEWKDGQWIGEGGMIDPRRGWIIAFCWLVACGADIYYLYTLIRRPRLILDFALTLLFNHLILTTYYAASFPSSLFFYLVVGAGAVMTLIVAEQLCVRREMREGLSVVSVPREDADGGDDEEVGLVEEMELGELGLPPRRD